MSERRRFTGRERVALYLAADGQCEECGVRLEPGWHGDHVQPWSKGGATDVTNGQGLCPNCNLTKGATMLELREWQNDALELFMHRQDDFLAVATPGAGKTTFALVAAQRLMERGDINRIIVVVPTSHLRGQWTKAAARIGIQLDHRYTNAIGPLARDFDGAAVTYATVATAPLLWRKHATDRRTLVILDEIHHASDAEHLSWGAALRQAFEPATRRLLLSGTPFRSDRTAIPFVEYRDGRCVASYNYDYGTALQDGDVVRPIEFPVLDGSVRYRNAGAVTEVALKDTDDETISKALASALDPSGDWITSVLRQADAELDRQRADIPDAGGLVIAADQAKARAYAEILRRINGDAPTVAISDEDDASALIDGFATGTAKWIVAVQMVTEGVDIPRLAVGVYASRVRTEMFFRQVVGRFVRLRGHNDGTYATLFIPCVQPLLQIAQDIERTVGTVLAEEEQQYERDRKERSTQTTLQFDLVEPLDSSEAIHSSTILSGDSVTEAELHHAEELMRTAGVPANWSAAQVAHLLRVAGTGRVVGTATVVTPQEKPLADRKKSVRTLLQRKVGKLARIKEVPHKYIHAQLNRICDDKAATATAETLEKRLEILDRWLEGA